MKTVGALFAVILTACFLGCGGSAETATSTEESVETTISTPATRREDRYPVPRTVPGKKPLEKLVAKDLEAGEGPAARWGDEPIVRYVGVSYRTGKVFSQHWAAPLNFALNGETFGLGWQRGIHGMRVGGRRELLIPDDLHYANEDLAYIVALVDLNSIGGAR